MATVGRRGDSYCVNAILGGVTTYYVGNHFEWQCFDPTCSTPKLVKYYYAGSQRVAMRQGNSGTLSFLLGDHLGSTSVTANSSGGKVAELRYHPWGGTRFTDGVTPTARRFTGQVEDATIGLYFYNARYYDPYLNRFISPDSMVPSPQSPQSLNRYSYVLNSPLNYIDPSGHREVRYSEGEWITQEVFSEYAGEWDIAEQARNRAIIETIFGVADTVAAILWEPYDWVSTGVRCTQGGCNALDYAGFLPLIPGALGRVDDVARVADKIDDTTGDLIRLVPTDQIGTSQPFKLRSGETGLSVFEDVSPQDVLDHFPGNRVPNTTVTIPRAGLPAGT